MSTKRSTRSHVVEFVLVAVAIVAIWLFLMNGGPSWAGGVWADLVGAP